MLRFSSIQKPTTSRVNCGYDGFNSFEDKKVLLVIIFAWVVLSASLRACFLRVAATRMNKLQSGPPRHGQIFAATTSICVVALELRRLVARDVPTTAYPYKTFYCLQIPITSRGRPVFRVVSCYDLLCQAWVFCEHFRRKKKKQQRTSEFSLAESKCADTGTNNFGILQRSLRSVAEGKTPPVGSADFEILHHANRRGILPSRGCKFSVIKMSLKKVSFRLQNCL